MKFPELKSRFQNVSVNWRKCITIGALACSACLLVFKSHPPIPAPQEISAPIFASNEPAAAPSAPNPMLPELPVENSPVAPAKEEEKSPLLEDFTKSQADLPEIKDPEMKSLEPAPLRALVEKVEEEVKPVAKPVVRKSRPRLAKKKVSSPKAVAQVEVPLSDREAVLQAFAELTTQETLPAPLETLAQTGLEEGSIETTAPQESAPEQAPTQGFVVSTYVQNDYNELKAEQADQRARVEALLTEEKIENAPAPEIVSPKHQAASVQIEETEEGTVIQSVTSPALASAEAVTPEIAASVSGPVLVRPKNLAPVAQTLPTTQASQPAVSTPPTTVAQAAQVARTLMSRQAITPEPELIEPEAGDRLYGVFSVDPALRDLLEATNGHVELSLEPTDHPGADPYALKFRYPESSEDTELRANFEETEIQLPKTARLWAYFYGPKNGGVPTASISKVITSSDMRQQIRFHVTKRKYEELASAVAVTSNEGHVLNITLFEGVSSPATRIEGAKVRIVNNDHIAPQISNKSGNVRFANVPPKSVMVHVTAQGYYDTYKVISTVRDAYAPIFLASHDKVETITKYFTKTEQDPEKGLIMGKVYDPTTRKPKEGEAFALYKSGKGLYFDQEFPNKMLPYTTKNGLFGFFNVDPKVAWRTLSRTVSEVATNIPLLLNVKPRSAIFLELGHSGLKSLMGRFFDPLSETYPAAQVKLVGQNDRQAVTNAKGEWLIRDLDLPSGVIGVEARSDEYRPALYSVLFDHREPTRAANYILYEDEMIRQLAKSTAGLTTFDPLKGNVVGSAQPALFEGHKGCVHVEIKDSNEKPASAQGPFVWDLKGKTYNTRCLTKEQSRYAFWGLAPGQYTLRWLETQKVYDQVTKTWSEKTVPFRAQEFFVAMDKDANLVD